MHTNTVRTALALAAAGLLFSIAAISTGATASALVSATVLGPAGEDTASGAVTLSRIMSTTSDVQVPKSDRSESPTIARFRVGGGSNASFAVSLPETVVVRGRGAELEVSGFRAAGSGRLGSDGTSTIAVRADVRIPSGQLAGSYAGTFPITIAYN